jgi:hypothetical protein
MQPDQRRPQRATINLNVAEITWRDPPGTLEKGLERHLLKVEHHHPVTLLDLILGEIPRLTLRFQ